MMKQRHVPLLQADRQIGSSSDSQNMECPLQLGSGLAGLLIVNLHHANNNRNCLQLPRMVLINFSMCPHYVNKVDAFQELRCRPSTSTHLWHNSWPSSPPLSLSLNGNITNYVYHVWICFLTTMKIKCQDCSMVNWHSLSLHNTVYG